MGVADLRSAVLAAALASSAASIGAADKVERLTGEPGSWLILVDAEKRPLSAWYWIAENALLLFPDRSAMGLFPSPNQMVVADSGFLPTRLTSVYLFDMRGFDYGPVPDYRLMTEPEPMAVEAYRMPIAIGDPPKLEDSYEMRFRWRGEELVDLVSGPLLVRRFSTTSFTHADRIRIERDGGPVERAFLPAFGVDVPETLLQKVVAIRHGSGMAASADLSFEVAAVADLASATAACLAGIRTDPAYAGYLGEFAALERRTADVIQHGQTDILAYGIAEYDALEKRTGIGGRFRACFGPEETRP